MIEPHMFDLLIQEFDLGTSTAEKDPLLERAQIRTQEFSDLYRHDRIDIVRGIKGAGKTALYRVFQLIKEPLADEGLLCIFGVEATGDPVFNQFRENFEKYTPVDFENFWIIYFLSLIRDRIARDPLFSKHFNSRDLAKLDKVWTKLDVPFNAEDQGLLGIVKSAIGRVKKVDGGLEFKPDGAVKPAVGLEFSPKVEVVSKPTYVGDAREALCNMFKEKGIRLWIMLDRLDEVFRRRSLDEENGLKGLLRASYNLSQPELRIKVFLRDDIIEQLAMSADGFTALTHVTDRASATMRWAKENMLLLIVKRIFAHQAVAGYFQVDQKRLDDNAIYREEAFYMVFPARVGKMATLEWIMNSCADANGIVTPRDVIDFLNFAKSVQFKEFQLNKCSKEHLISQDSLKSGMELLSKQKRDKFLMAEFPHMRENILRLEGKYSIHNAQSLEYIYGGVWSKVVGDLIAIGLVKHDPKKATYKIPKLWLKGLRITQGTAFKHGV